MFKEALGYVGSVADRTIGVDGLMTGLEDATVAGRNRFFRFALAACAGVSQLLLPGSTTEILHNPSVAPTTWEKAGVWIIVDGVSTVAAVGIGVLFGEISDIPRNKLIANAGTHVVMDLVDRPLGHYFFQRGIIHVRSLH